MKATLEFDDEDDLRTAIDGYKWKLVVWDLNQKLRAYLKYDESISDEKYDMTEQIKEDLLGLINDYNLNLD